MGKVKQIYTEVTDLIRECLYRDLRKFEIREVVKDKYPGFPPSEFELCFTEAFTSL
jgi:hypothetical protein